MDNSRKKISDPFRTFACMSGVYIHIPFCKQACHYCDFHFSTSLQYKQELLDALAKEMALRAGYLDTKKIQTLYFGGGTPSLLEADEINKLIDQLTRYYELDDYAEITLEANPDDLHPQKVKALRHTPVNRFSIGIQSFFEEDLTWMNRAHHAKEADAAIKRVQDAGFENITADLIYGYPLLTDEKWHLNIQQLLQMDIPHISAYSMTVEPQTALAHFIRSGTQQTMDEEQSARQFELLVDTLQRAGFEQYEISNFAKPGRYARHNTNYWRSVSYLGLGPSAHSFNGRQRQWNISHNAQYLKAIANDQIPAELEELTEANRLNEYIMTALRTMWGIDLSYMEKTYGTSTVGQVLDGAASFIAQELLLCESSSLKLTLKGKLVADRIAAALFFDE